MTRICDIRKVKSGGSVTVSAKIDEFELYFRFPEGYEIPNSAAPFISAAFFASMKSGLCMSIDRPLPVSSVFLAALPRLQEIFKCWYPSLSKFDLSEDDLEIGCQPAANPGVASFFSGGIDGLYTLCRNVDEITHLIFINGFDFQMSEADFRQAVARNATIAKKYNKILVPVETNFWSFMKSIDVSRPINHGSCLASIGQLLAFTKVYIPATYTYNDLHPWGSHPLTDGLWSTNTTSFVHDGAEAKRTEKTVYLFEYDQTIFNELVVCWFDPNENCGECGKCLRTMITLDVLGVESEKFPKKLKTADIKKLWIATHGDLSYCEENLELAARYGKHEIVRALKHAVFKYRLRAIGELLMQYLKNPFK